MTWFAVGGAAVSLISNSGGRGSSASPDTFRDLETIEESQLEIDEEGLQKIIEDILGGAGGLADIFNEENVAGIFGSSVAAQASGDLVTNLAGELAKLTAKTTTTKTEVGETGGAGVAGVSPVSTALEGAQLGSLIGKGFA